MNPDEIATLYDRSYADAYDDRFLKSELTRADAEYELGLLRSYLGQGKTWLDVACGTGYFLSQFPEVERVGVDISPAMLERARNANPGVEIVPHDFRIPKAEWIDQFDLVSCMWYAYGYAESMREISQLIANLASWTSRSGRCFVPLADPDLLARQTITHHPEMGQPGDIYITGVTWSFVEEDGRVHSHMLAPALAFMVEQFGQFFDGVEIFRYPVGYPGTGKRPFLLASGKKPFASALDVVSEQFAPSNAPHAADQHPARPVAPLLRSYLVRPRAWWFNKIPLSITLLLLLADGGRVNLASSLALVLVVLTVCAVGNYGYALNDLYDIDEDARAQRSNAAAMLGRARIGWIVIVSAMLAEMFAILAAGWSGGILTLVELALPMAYSLPGLRIKERKWLGVAADALAAHVYPAVLALLAVGHFGVRPFSTILAVCLVAWSLAAGIRGILSHQLHTADRDRQAQLVTVVHDFGHTRLELFIMAVLVPIELAGFVGAMAACNPGLVLLAFGFAYLCYELFKTFKGGFHVTAFRPEGQPYLPFVEESFYKAWGPLVIAIDAMRVDLVFLVALPLYVLLFRPHMNAEANRLGGVWRALRRPVGRF